MRTDWDNVAGWYDNYLEGTDTYQEKVILPNVLRMLDLAPGVRVLDIACGQGYFSRRITTHDVQVVGIDQSETLIQKAGEHAGVRETYIHGNAETLETYTLGMFDRAYSVLAFENIKNIAAVCRGLASVLKPTGKTVVVLLHPAFRIPQHSDWHYNLTKKVQYRTVGKYLSELAIPIDLSPHKKGGAVKTAAKNNITTTFHRSLQWYMKTFKTAGFAITGLEEWISHKKSDPGPRQQAEDAARKEIPMFLALELKKIQ